MLLTRLLFPQPPAHEIHIKFPESIPFAGHHRPSGPLPGQPLGTEGILKCFPCVPDISASLGCFFTPPSCCCKISLSGEVSPTVTIRIKPSCPGLWGFPKCSWGLHYLPSPGEPGHGVPPQGPSPSQLQILLLPKGKMSSPMGHETSQT